MSADWKVWWTSMVAIFHGGNSNFLNSFDKPHSVGNRGSYLWASAQTNSCYFLLSSYYSVGVGDRILIAIGRSKSRSCVAAKNIRLYHSHSSINMMILLILSISALRCRLPWGDSLECYSKRYSEWPLDNLDRCPGADSRIHVLNHRIPVLKRWFHDWNRSVTKPPWWYVLSAFNFIVQQQPTRDWLKIPLCD